MRIVLDACATGLGYILLNVNPDGTETPLFYGGRSTTRAERNYSATELELAALLAAVKAYSSYIANTEFEIVTDHISFTYIRNLRFGPSKLVRASLLLNQFRFKVTHLAGRKNSAADSLSRTDDLQMDPLTLHENSRFQTDDTTDLRLDYATDKDCADESYENSSCKTRRDASTQCDLTEQPSQDIGLPTRGTSNSNKKHTIQPETNHIIHRKPLPTPNSVNSVQHSQCSSEATTANDGDISLHTQRTDAKLANIIDYLQHGELPTDDKIDRRVCLTKDQFAIRDNNLIHIGIKRRKNNGADHPIVEQICIPSALQPIILARYHAQLMHCGHEKMYLTLKERVYWENMYTDVRNYVANCEQCHTAKVNNHPIKAKLHSREVPPQIF